MFPLAAKPLLTDEPLPTDLLPSWNEGEVKNSILNFMKNIEEIPPKDRVAVIDFDGTLVPEKLIAYQAKFLLDSSIEVVEGSTKELLIKVENAFKGIFSLEKSGPSSDNLLEDAIKNLEIEHLDEQLLLVDNYRQKAEEWIQTEKHHRFNMPYNKLMYQPMREFIQLLQRHEFSINIVSGSGQEFLHSVVPHIININKKNIFGTILETESVEINGELKEKFTGRIVKKNNYEGKVETIAEKIKQIPIVAVGNSDGDEAMLNNTLSSKANLAIIIHHTDSKEEYKYGSFSINGRLSHKTQKAIKEKGGLVVDMKKNWNTIFSPESAPI